MTAVRETLTSNDPVWSRQWVESNADICETLILRSRDALDLTGYYYPATVPSKYTVIIAHGYSGTAFSMSSYAGYYHDELGFNVLLPDARAHGNSGGAYIGMGWPDRLDYADWIQMMINRNGPDTVIVLHGLSMGGATVLMTSGEDLPPNVQAIIDDCGYTSAEAQFAHLMNKMYRINSPVLLKQTSKLTKERAGYSFEEASALEQVKKSRIPTLFIHGEADDFVPFTMVQELYDACSAPKELYTVPGAGHAMACSTNPDEYIRQVRLFLAEYVNPSFAP
jgi:hypothetical protein